jgi:hypothetical protein
MEDNEEQLNMCYPLGARGDWTIEQDESLRASVRNYGAKSWKQIASEIPGEKSHVQW